MSSELFAKRAAPFKASPVSHGEHQFSATRTHEKHKYSVSILCEEKSGKKAIWKTKIYEKQVDPELEFDAQDIYVKSLDMKGEVLVAVDERNRMYRLDSKTGKLLEPARFHIYPKKIDSDDGVKSGRGERR